MRLVGIESMSHRAGTIPAYVVKKAGYSRELRDEVFGLEPLHSLVKLILLSTPYPRVFDEVNFPLVAATYDWVRIRITVDQIISACDLNIPFSLPDALAQAWVALPTYLARYRKFHPHTGFLGGVPCVSTARDSYPELVLMHTVLVGVSATAAQIQRSGTLEAGTYLSLDTGFITKTVHASMLKFNRLISASATQIRTAVHLLNTTEWDEIDLDGILATIRNNHGTRYYDITTDRVVNVQTIKKMVHVNHTHRVVAVKSDAALFDHIISLLDAQSILTPSPNPFYRRHTDHGDIVIIHDSSDSEDSSSSSDLRSYSSSSESSYSESNSYSSSHSEMSSPSDSEVEEVRKAVPVKRKAIPAKIRHMTWRKHIGPSMDGRCWCCNDAITFENWHAGHVLAHTHGGKNTVDNLRPVCAACNLSMRDTHMAQFIHDHALTGNGSQEFQIAPSSTTPPSVSPPTPTSIPITFEIDLGDLTTRMANITL